MKPTKLDFTGKSTAGIVTVDDAVYAPDGRGYYYLFSANWRVTTDAEIPLPNFRSAERWQLMAMSEDGEDILMIIPGCRIRAWMYSLKSPGGSCYTVD